MENFKDTIIASVESVLNSVNTNSCTIYKEEYESKYSLGMFSQAYQYMYMYVLNNQPKVGVFVDISYTGIDICLFRYASNSFSKNMTFKLFQTEQLTEYLNKAFEEIQF